MLFSIVTKKIGPNGCENMVSLSSRSLEVFETPANTHLLPALHFGHDRGGVLFRGSRIKYLFSVNSITKYFGAVMRESETNQSGHSARFKVTLHVSLGGALL